MKALPFVTCLWVNLLIGLFPSPVQAQSSVKSDNYEITWPNLNMGAGLPTSDTKNINVTTGQIAPGLYTFTEAGFKIRAGFQYIHSIIPFAFTISDLTITFTDPLVPGTPATAANALTVACGGAGGYVIKASENKPLTSASASTIPDTTCDNSDCDQSTAAAWTNNAIYGFGFNMSGSDIPADFTGSTMYRQFADRSNSETPAIIMTGANVGKDIQSTVTYKINVSNTQAAGRYQNIITFMAIPTY